MIRFEQMSVRVIIKSLNELVARTDLKLAESEAIINSKLCSFKIFHKEITSHTCSEIHQALDLVSIIDNKTYL